MVTTIPTRRELLAALAGLAGAAALGPCAALADPIPAGLRLVFIEDAACVYCRKWLKEVGATYDETPPGRLAPLVRRSMGDASLSGFSRLQFTPTFILVRNGREIDRRVGYAGAEEFWEGLRDMLAKAGPGVVPDSPGPAARQSDETQT